MKILITGASSGIGLRLTLDYLQAGHSVLGTYFSNPKPLLYLQKKFPNLEISKLDLATADDLQLPKDLDAAILNAGVIANKLMAHEMLDNFNHLLNVNLKSNYLLCKKLIPCLHQAKNPHIIFISSRTALKGNVGQISYSTSKAALIGLAKSLAREVAAMNIKVNIILPGFLKTKQTATLLPDIINNFTNENLLKRTNTLHEVSKFIYFLTLTRNISGQVYNLDSRI